MGDIKNGGITPLNCEVVAGSDVGCSDIRSLVIDADVCRVGDGDGEDRRFLFSVATIASFAFLFLKKKICTNGRSIVFISLYVYLSIEFLLWRTHFLYWLYKLF